MSVPSVAILIVNYNGRAHLETCLPSLTALEYPRDRFDIVLVDNASTDDSVAFARERFPDVRVIRHDRNLGFAAAYHAAVPHTRSDCLAFLNNDTRVDAGWLRELVAAGERHGAASIASKIVDWDGQRVDFGGGILTLTGHAWQIDNGQPAATHALDERPLLFACGGAMLVDRGAYEDAGGFDPDYFAYFEDVDLGWRLSLLGFNTVLAPRALTYHRFHGTAGRTALAPRLRLYERNALYTIIKCYEEATLFRILPVAVALTLARGLKYSNLDPNRFAFGASPPKDVAVAPHTIATLLALEDVTRHLPRLREKRAQIQSRRRRSDAALFPLFVDPLKVHEHGEPYERLARELYEEFGLADLVKASAIHPPPAALGPPPAALGPPPADGLPSISVIILTALGPTHLPECLSSLRQSRYPLERVEVIVVDNGSQVDPTPVVHAHCPSARVIRVGRNAGFCGGNNEGARQATGEWLFILNDDTRVDPDCLAELVATARRHGAVSVGARILDWTGERLDFGGAGVNFEGRGFQIGLGSRDTAGPRERPILFGCGAALLIDRRVFLEVGGFDEAMFAYYEDLALGWQLWIRGHDVWFSPGAVVYHKHHGTSGRWPEPPRIRLYERNAFRILFTLLERPTLARVLPAALLLASERALLVSQLGARDGDDSELFASPLRRFYWRAKPRSLWHHTLAALKARGAARARGALGSLRTLGVRGIAGAFWSTATFVARDQRRDQSRRAGYLIERGLQPPTFDGRQEPLPAPAAAILVAINEWLQSIGEQRERRASIQQARRRTDADVLSRFSSHWTDPVGTAQQAFYEKLHRGLVEALEIAHMPAGVTAAARSAAGTRDGAC